MCQPRPWKAAMFWRRALQRATCECKGCPMDFCPRQSTCKFTSISTVQITIYSYNRLSTENKPVSTHFGACLCPVSKQRPWWVPEGA